MSGMLRWRFAVTKLRAPTQRHDEISRPRLTEPLIEASGRGSVVTITAPAGFGKTTVLRQAAERHPGPSAWVWLDPEDDDPLRLLALVAAGVRHATGWELAAASAVLADAGAAGRPTAEQSDQLLAALVNDLQGHDQDLLAVFDDVHLLQRPDTAKLLDRFLLRAPANVHPVLAGRDTPPVSLERLRSRGQVSSLDGASLGMDVEEVAGVLAEPTRSSIDQDLVRRVHARTEGWPAAVGLIGASLAAGSPRAAEAPIPPAAAVAFESLAAQVLHDMPGELREMLLDVAVLADLDAPRCRALSGREDAGALLQRLERLGLLTLLHPGDAMAGPTYHLHSLLADAVRARLRDSDPQRLCRAHRRAAQVEANPQRILVHLAAAGEDAALGATLVRVGPELVDRGLQATVRAHLDHLPAAARHDDVRLVHLLGNCELAGGDLGAARSAFAEAVEQSSVRPGIKAAARARLAETSLMMTIQHLADPYFLGRNEGPVVLDWAGLHVGMKARAEDTGDQFLLFEYEAPPGFAGPPWHVHQDLDEANFVISGTLTVKVGESRRNLGAGEFAWLPRNVPHGFCNEGDEPARFLGIVSPPGGIEPMMLEIADYVEGLDGPPDPERMDGINRRHGVEVLGPPILTPEHA